MDANENMVYSAVVVGACVGFAIVVAVIAAVGA